MKKKYVKPSLTQLPVINAGADDGFEILGLCLTGTSVGPYSGACNSGGSAGYYNCPQGASPVLGTGCVSGSADVKETKYCFAGNTV